MKPAAVLVLVGTVAAVPAGNWQKHPVLAVKAGKCVGVSGEGKDTDWCVQNCAVGFCPTDRCKCDGSADAAAEAGGAQAAAAAPAATVPTAAVPAAASAARVCCHILTDVVAAGNSFWTYCI